MRWPDLAVPAPPALVQLAHAAVLRTLNRPCRHRLPYVLYGYAHGDGERLRRSQIAADAALGFVLECLNPWETGGSPGAALHQMFSVLLPDAHAIADSRYHDSRYCLL